MFVPSLSWYNDRFFIQMAPPQGVFRTVYEVELEKSMLREPCGFAALTIQLYVCANSFCETVFPRQIIRHIKCFCPQPV
jgi:hypothetical protein